MAMGIVADFVARDSTKARGASSSHPSASVPTTETTHPAMSAPSTGQTRRRSSAACRYKGTARAMIAGPVSQRSQRVDSAYSGYGVSESVRAPNSNKVPVSTGKHSRW